MKRSEAIIKLLPKITSKYEIVHQELYDGGFYHQRAEELLSFMENELGLHPVKLNESGVIVEFGWDEEKL